MNIYRGIGASEGVAIGKALKINSAFVNYPRISLESEDLIPREIERIREAQTITEKQIIEIMDQSQGLLNDEISNVFSSYQMFVRDKRFIPAIAKKIETQKINAEWALIRVLSELEEQFKQISDPYIRSRFDDIRQLGKRLMNNLQSKPQLDLSQLDNPVIIVCEDISPADAFHLSSDNILGIVTELGGTTSHSSILARAMNIPAVVGVKKITNRIMDDAPIILDGLSGEVIENPSDEAIKNKLNKQEQFAFFQNQLLELRSVDCALKDGVKVSLAANLDFLEEVSQIQYFNIPSIGLIRTEFLFYHEDQMPEEDEQVSIYRKIIRESQYKPITIRTWDIGSDKTSKLFEELENESNPALGLRAIRLCLKHTDIFRSQIRAIIRASEESKVRLLIPMVTRLDEVVKAKSIILEEQINLGISDDNLEIGCMIETPSSTFIIDDLFDLVDFISIGTNDLIQYALAVDRMNEHVADLFTPFHPSILKMLEKIVSSANRRDKDVSICGELAADPIMQMFLLGVGNITFSMTPNQVLKTKHILRKVDSVTCKKIAFQFISKHSLEESNLFVQHLREKYVDDIYDHK